MALREQLLAVADELRRRKADGEKTVAVSEETLLALRAAVAGQGQPPAAAASIASSPASPPPPAAARPAAPSAPAVKTAAPSPAPAPRNPLFGDEPAKAAKKIAPPAGGADIPPATPFALPAGDKATQWAWLKDHVENDPVCRAHVRPGKKIVLGVGSLDARIFFCGEAPGADEEVQGEPFVGPAGQLLTKMIKAMGLERAEVYIGNIMNWRPEMPTPAGVEQVGNRPPTPEEMAYCLPHLKAQLEIVRPALIVALGATAAAGLLGAGSFRTLGEIRGKWQQFAGLPVMVTYHPSYLLRNNSNRAKRTVWEDLLLVMERAQLPISDKQRNYFLER